MTEQDKEANGVAIPVKNGPKPMTLRQKIMVAMMGVQSFVCFLMIALMSPFFPDEAKRKGASIAQTDIIFSLLFLVIFLTSPLFGRYITTIGPKFLYISGLYARTFVEIMFGFINRMAAGTPFITMAFVLRIFEAIGGSAFSTAAYAIMAREFPDRTSVMFGFLQTTNSIGLMGGPPIGGLMYDFAADLSITSFTFPFLVLGCFSLVITTVNWAVLPEMHHEKKLEDGKDQQHTKPSMFKLLRNPRILLCVCCVSIANMPMVFIEISLEQHLDIFGMPPSIVGLMFTIETGTFAIAATIWGWIDDRCFYPRLQIGACCIVYTFACLLLGPSPLLPFNTEVWLVGMSLSMVGMNLSSINIASYKDCVNQAIAMGFPDHFDTYGVISGLFLFSFTSGAFLGPTIGGVLVEALSLPWALTVYAALLLALGLLNFAVGISSHFGRRRQRRDQKETVPLLKS